MDPDVATSSSSSSSLSSSTNPNRNHLSMSSSSSNHHHHHHHHHHHQDHHQNHQNSARYGCGSCCYPHRDQKDHHCLYRCRLLHHFSQWRNWTWNCWTAHAKVENSSMDSPAGTYIISPNSFLLLLLLLRFLFFRSSFQILFRSNFFLSMLHTNRSLLAVI